MTSKYFRTDSLNFISSGLNERLKNFIKSPSWLNRLITLNISVFLCLWIFKLVTRVVDYLYKMPSNSIFNRFNELISCPSDLTTLLHQPWSIITSLFVHSGVWHLLFNMLILYFIGRIFLQYINEKHFLMIYFLGGIVGNIVYIISYNVFPVFSDVTNISYAVGASACVMAILSAIATFRPDHQINLFILIPISIITIAIIFVIIDILSISKENSGGHLAHLGGFFLGFIYILIFKRKLKKVSQSNTQSTKTKKYYVSKESGRPISDEEYNARKHQVNLKIDSILDKISKSGYESLSKEEKDFLFHYSKK